MKMKRVDLIPDGSMHILTLTGSMIDDAYTRRFLELLRYVPYLMEDNTKI